MKALRSPYALIAYVIVATAFYLLAIGRAPICKCGVVKIWSGDVFSADNSQHLLDWYSPSHLLHGLLFFAGLWLVARRFSFGQRLAIATVIECGWEILENSDFVINRYRELTISYDYFGDSVINSVSDICMMLLGFSLARILPVWLSVALVVGFEVLTAFVIRDGLTLNVLMLLFPIEAVKVWQGGL